MMTDKLYPGVRRRGLRPVLYGIVILALLLSAGCGEERTAPFRGASGSVDTSDVHFGPDSIETEDISLGPTFLLSPSQQVRLRRMVRSDTSAANRFEDVLARAVVALHDHPNPIDTLVYEGRLQRNPKRLATKKAVLDMEKMRALGYAYAVSEDPQYADALAEYLHAWATTTAPTGNPINANKLAASIFAYDLVKERLPEDRRETCRKWLASLGDALIETTPDSSASRSNWHTKRIRMVGLMGVALPDSTYRQYAVSQFQRYVSEALNADGTSQDFEERDALSYHKSALEPLVNVAIEMESEEEPLYTYRGEKGGSVAHSVAFLLPFVRGDTTHAEWINSQVSFDRERYEAGQEEYRPGSLWNPKSAIDLFELTSVYEPSHRAVIDSLDGPPNLGRYPTWQTVVAEASAHK